MSNLTTITTGDGVITSRRIAWMNGDRAVWVWRTDGENPLDFGSPDAAQAWIDHLLTGGSSPAERRELGAWTIATVAP